MQFLVYHRTVGPDLLHVRSVPVLYTALAQIGVRRASPQFTVHVHINVEDSGRFYLHMSSRRGRLTTIEIAGLVNQMLFHLSSIFEFRGLSQKVSALFLAAVGAGTAFQYLEM